MSSLPPLSAIVMAALALGASGSALAQTPADVPPAPAPGDTPAPSATPDMPPPPPAGTVIQPRAAGAPEAEPPPLEPAARFRPSIGVQVVSTTNANITTSSDAKSDTVITVTPGATFYRNKGNTRLDGRVQLNSVTYVNGAQKDRVLPAGEVNLRTGWLDQGVGVDLQGTAEQVTADYTTRGAVSTNTSSSYTNTRASVSPFFERQLDADHSIDARYRHSWLRSQRNSNELASRPDTRLGETGLRFRREPTPVGYILEWEQDVTYVEGVSGPSLKQRAARGTLTYAVSPELHVGGILGRESADVLLNDYSDTIRGAYLSWHPTERTDVDATVERRYFGNGWRAALQHRTPSFAMGITTRRSVETYISGISTGSGGALRDLFDAMLTTRISDIQERQRAVDNLLTSRNLPSELAGATDLYDLNPAIQQQLSGRLAFMGRRNTVAVTGGVNKTQPLQRDGVLLTQAARTREYFLDGEWVHQMTRTSTLTGGLRWTRANYQFTGLDVTTSREASARVVWNVRLSPNTTTSLGLRRQIVHTPTVGDANESAVFAGLDHRF